MSEARIYDEQGFAFAAARAKPFLSPNGMGTEVCYRVSRAGSWHFATSRFPYVLNADGLAADLRRHVGALQ